MTTAYIALGSNLDNPLQQVLTAIDEIGCLPKTKLGRRSKLYRTAPVGPPGQDDYINAVVEVDTELTPLELLNQLQGLEQDHQRKRLVHWGPRTLDLDILLYGERTINSPRLVIPHKEMHWRSFVLQPLADIDPELVLPTGQPLQKLLQNLAEEENKPIAVTE